MFSSRPDGNTFYRIKRCIGFSWEHFGSGGTTGEASVRSCEKLPPCLIKPVPAGSKMDPLVPKAEPVSDGGSASGVKYLRTGETKSGQL